MLTARSSTIQILWLAALWAMAKPNRPLATSWHSNKSLNPGSDGSCFSILHLNGYKIANPTVGCSKTKS
jgi:hypothetical protein